MPYWLREAFEETMGSKRKTCKEACNWQLKNTEIGFDGCIGCSAIFKVMRRTQQTDIFVVLIFDEFYYDLLFRLELQQLEQQTHEVRGLPLTSISAS